MFEQAKLQSKKIMEDAIIIAYAIAAIQGRETDDISANEAYKIYDRGWIIDRTRRGMLHFNRKGAAEKSAKIYSRFEIESLKRAEKQIEEAYNTAIERAKGIMNK